MEENNTKDQPLEKLLEELDTVLSGMEARNTTLEESFSLYEKGMKLIRKCEETLDRVEKQVRVLEEENPDEF